MTEERWFGTADSPCGEHRTVGSRAWCFRCQEWCYPTEGMRCRGCEVGPPGETELTRLREQVQTLTEALEEFVAALDEAPPLDLLGYISRAGDRARAALTSVKEAHEHTR
jgi:hypothetical protein